MDELRDLLVVQKGDKDICPSDRMESKDIMDVCESLIVHDQLSGTVRFTHYTIRQFLLSSDLLPLKSNLAETCLTYLSFNAAQAGIGADLDSYIKQYPGSLYVAQNWGFHVKAAGDAPEMHENVLEV